MVNIRPAKTNTCLAIAIGVQWASIVTKCRIPQPEFSTAGEGLPVSTISSGQHAIEHIDA